MRGRLIEPNLNEHDRTTPKFLRIKHRPHRFNETLAEQPFHSLARTRRRQADTIGEIEGGAPSVFLQQPED